VFPWHTRPWGLHIPPKTVQDTSYYIHRTVHIAHVTVSHLGILIVLQSLSQWEGADEALELHQGPPGSESTTARRDKRERESWH